MTCDIHNSSYVNNLNDIQKKNNIYHNLPKKKKKQKKKKFKNF